MGDIASYMFAAVRHCAYTYLYLSVWARHYCHLQVFPGCYILKYDRSRGLFFCQSILGEACAGAH